jgi:hypothetical protein
MSNARSDINQEANFFFLLSFLLNLSKPRKNKTYDYTDYVCGRDYVFELIEDKPGSCYMTSQSKGIKVGDRIILQNTSISGLYEVEEIEYYSEPSDMWMGLLKKVIVVSQ